MADPQGLAPARSNARGRKKMDHADLAKELEFYRCATRLRKQRDHD